MHYKIELLFLESNVTLLLPYFFSFVLGLLIVFLIKILFFGKLKAP